MKAGKDGKLKLSKDERQVGSFVYKNEAEYIKICDINSQMTHRVGKHLNIGRFLEMGLKEKDDNSLTNYATLLWLFSNILPDVEFVKDINKDITPEEDKEILQEAKETIEAIEELKKEE